MKRKISKKEIKELLVKYLSSKDEEIIFIYNDGYISGYINAYKYSQSIKMHDFTSYYLTEYGYCYDVSEIKSMDTFELIKIFLNIFHKSKFIFEKYKKNYLNYKLDIFMDSLEIHFKFKEIDKKIFNLINEFLKNLSIKIIRNKGSVDLDFSYALFLNKRDITDPIQITILEYLKIKKLINDNDTINKRSTYLSGLKNELDDLVKKGDINNKYINFDVKKFRKWIQSLISHKGSECEKNPEFKEIKDEFKNSNNKSGILDNLFDSLILLYLYNKILN